MIKNKPIKHEDCLHEIQIGKQYQNQIEAKNVTSGELALTEKEILMVYKNLHSLRDEVLIKLAICTGMRRADIVRVQRDLIDFENKRVTYLEKKKGDKPHSAPLSEEMLRLIGMYITVSRKSKWLFPSEHTTQNRLGHLGNRTAWDVFNKALRASGLQERKFHSLRATAVKHAQRLGWRPEQTAKLINDKVETVLKHYSTPSRDEMDEVSREKPLV